MLERYADADSHFQQAHLVAERLGAKLWAAQGRLDHGRMLLDWDRPGDRDRARELLEAARDAFTDAGVHVYASRAVDLLDRLGPLASVARAVQEGEHWTFQFGGDVARLRDSKGVQYLVQLLRRPGQDVHAVDLSGTGDPEKARQSASRAIRGAVDRVAEAHPALGRHLRATVRTGLLSSYVPDPRAPVTWDCEG